jgi:hypothetical protein
LPASRRQWSNNATPDESISPTFWKSIVRQSGRFSCDAYASVSANRVGMDAKFNAPSSTNTSPNTVEENDPGSIVLVVFEVAFAAMLLLPRRILGVAVG